MTGSKILQVEDLRTFYVTPKGYVRAVDGVSFTLDKGESLAVVGESGSGKTTLGLTLMRALPRNATIISGSVLLNGKDILLTSLNEFREEYSWKVISMVFQGAMNALNPVIKVGEQVAEPLIIKGRLPKDEARKVAEEFIELVGMPKAFYDRYPHELSGGMKQRIVIAMALVMKPQILILDEPTSALDVTIQAQIINMIKDIIENLGLSVIFITHDISLASEIADRVAVMYGGELVEIGRLDQVLGESPKHPYTEKLLASLPRLRGDNIPEFIPGRPPDLTSPPSGCRFHPRCPFVVDKCKNEAPPLFRLNGEHHVKCWLRSG